jgi:hypothetical protein
MDEPLEIGIRPFSGAIQVLSRLLNFGPLLFVTARPTREPILAWMQNHIGLDDPGELRIETVMRYKDKLPALLKHGAKYFVEDRLETCYIVDQGPVTPIVFDQPWNRKPHPFQTVKGWDDIADMIKWL